MSTRASLENRFNHFVRTFPGAEVIDSLDWPDHPSKRRKADFLLEERQVVIELKTLTKNTADKVEREMDRHRERREFPLFYGTRDIQSVLADLPDGKDINRRIFGAITRSIEGDVRSAEEQITHTKHVLELSTAAGMLVILNDSIDVLDPAMAGHRVASLMKRQRTGNNDSDKIDFACLIFESHSVGGSASLPVFSCMLIQREGAAAKFPWFENFFQRFLSMWASFNGGALIDGGSPQLDKLKFKATSELLAPQPTHLPRHEIWRREYDANPHLRSRSNADVLQLGRRLLAELTPHFLVGGPEFVPETTTLLLQQFTGFVQEMNYRGLDMHNLQKP